MAQKRCPSGAHVYDADKHTFCPFCAAPPSPQPPPVDAVKTTFAGGGRAMPHDTPIPAQRLHKSGATTVVIGGGSGTSSPAVAAEYVAGWLVVINGNGRGHDLRIPLGQSKVGRTRGDIVLNFGDTTISNEKHAMLAYDPDENIFFIAGGEGRNLVKVNGKTIMNRKVLNPFDRIRVGQTDLLFVPLCGDNFNWAQTHAGTTSPPPQQQEVEQEQPDNRVKTRLYFEEK
jgi:hypothetical protein